MRTKLDVQEYYSSRGRLGLAIISCGALLTGGVLLCVYTKLYLLGGIMIPVALYSLFVLWKAKREHRPALRFDARGLYINTGQLEVDLMWSEIEQCRGNSMHGMDSVCVYLKDPAGVLERMNPGSLKKKMFQSNLKNLGTFVFFPTTILNLNTIEILRTLEAYRKTANKIE